MGVVSEYVSNLVDGLTQQNHKVDLVVEDDHETRQEKRRNLTVHRVLNPIKTHYGASILSSALTGSVRIEQEASDIIYHYKHRKKRIDLVHAHEWLSIQPALSLKYAFGLPFVFTLYSVEGHRCHDDFGLLSIAISDIERIGIIESAKTIVQNEWMKKEVLRYYGEENQDKIEIIQPDQLLVVRMTDIYKSIVSS